MQENVITNKLRDLGISEEEYQEIMKKLISNPDGISKEEFVILKKSLERKEQSIFASIISRNAYLTELDIEYEAEKTTIKPGNIEIGNLASHLSAVFNNDSAFKVVGGVDALFYGITSQDYELWNGYIHYRDDKSIQAIISAKKFHLLTHVIGNPKDEFSKFLRYSEVGYGNTMLHDRVVNSCDKSIIAPTNSDTLKALMISRKATDYLLRFYELHLKNAEKYEHEGKDALAKANRDRVSSAINQQDVQGKTPLLLSCKGVNDEFSQRLVLLDINRETINVADNLEQRTPLHIACIMGLKRTAGELIKAGADVNVPDKYGHNPYEYLSCSEREAEENIADVLESIHFFQDIFFGMRDKEQVIVTISKSRQDLASIPHDSQCLLRI